jgi:hypothetical protein
MLSSITPLGERGRGRRWGVTTGAYLAGSVAAGAAVGWALGLIGLAVTSVAAPDPGSLLVVAAGLSLAGFAADLGLGGLRLPGPRRQVNEDWLDQFRGWVVGLGWGAQLGTGVVTIVTSSTIYLAWVLAALSAAPAAGAAIGVAFGLARAVPLLGMAGVATPARLAAVHERLDRLAPIADRAATWLLVPVAAALAALAVST